MLTNADFYGRRGVVVQKGAEGFKFANPGSMRVSLSEALRDSASDPRNGVMMKMLALVEYGERAGSGLQGIFKTWECVFHCKPILEVTTADGIDRTTLSLNFEGHQPDIEAMKKLYGMDVSQNVPQKDVDIPQNVPQKKKSSQESIPKDRNSGISKYRKEDNKTKIIRILTQNKNTTLSEIADQLKISLIGVKKLLKHSKKRV